VADCVPDFGLAFLAILIGLPLALALAAGWTTDLRQHIGRTVAGAIVLGGLFLVFVLIAAVVHVLARDFLVPIMALENLDFADGWHRLLTMIRPEKGRYAVYLLLKLVLSIAAGILFGIIALLPGLLVFVPAALAVVAGHTAGWVGASPPSVWRSSSNFASARFYLPRRFGVRAGHRLLSRLCVCTFLPLAIRRLMRC